MIGVLERDCCLMLIKMEKILKRASNIIYNSVIEFIVMSIPIIV